MAGLFNEEATVVVERHRAEPQTKQQQSQDPEYLDLHNTNKVLDGIALYSSPLLDAATELLSTLVTIPRQGSPRNIERFRQQILKGISDFRTKGLYLDYHPSCIDKSCFILCAAFDEAILYTSWGQQAHWENFSLLSKVFSQRNGGEDFFVLAKKAQQQPSKLVDFLELQYILLMLGFKGKFRDGGEHELSQITADIYATVRYFREEAEFVAPKPAQFTPAQQPTRLLSLRRTIFAMLMILPLGYAASEYWYSNRSIPLIAQLSSLDKTALSLSQQQQVLVYLSTDKDLGIEPKTETDAMMQHMDISQVPTWEVLLASFTQQQDALRLAQNLQSAGYQATLKKTAKRIDVVLAAGEDLSTTRNLKNEINIRFSLNATIRRAQK